ncbi:hypothetical protein OAO01_03320 [Oligoflexia bacterium]|nr:hypothetical protein [Oligoflexia bacterium]
MSSLDTRPRPSNYGGQVVNKADGDEARRFAHANFGTALQCQKIVQTLPEPLTLDFEDENVVLTDGSAEKVEENGVKWRTTDATLVMDIATKSGHVSGHWRKDA